MIFVDQGVRRIWGNCVLAMTRSKRKGERFQDHFNHSARGVIRFSDQIMAGENNSGEFVGRKSTSKLIVKHSHSAPNLLGAALGEGAVSRRIFVEISILIYYLYAVEMSASQRRQYQKK